MTDAILLFALTTFVSLGTATLVYYLMHARMEVAVAKEREHTTTAQVKLDALETSLTERIRAAEQAAEHRALNTFLEDFRVEEQRYRRGSKSNFLARESVVLQERLYFRNIPLSNWVEHEVPVDEMGELAGIGAPSVFRGKTLMGATQIEPKYLTRKAS